jgi:hypothetical protein
MLALLKYVVTRFLDFQDYKLIELFYTNVNSYN